MAGSSGSGDDIEAGRTNWAESTTVVQGGRPSELNVGFNGRAVLEAGARRDDQRPDGTVSGVLGRGWNGAGTPAQREPGAGIIGVGAPNRGPGVVGLGGGHRITSMFLGSPGNLGEDGLGGTGMIGIGGPGDAIAPVAASADVAADVPSLPGAGVVGKGGTSFFPAPVAGSPGPGTGNGPGIVGIAGGRQPAPDGNLSQSDLADTANVGVVGFGGDGPKPVAVGGPFIGPVSAGAGVRGIGGVATVTGAPLTRGGPGVVGVAGGVTVPADGALADIGVAGFGGGGSGVFGVSGGFPGVTGSSTSAAGVAGGSSSGVGVAGSSGASNGGYFTSARVAQIHLEPLRDALADPNGNIPGRAGDLLVLKTRQEAQIVTLWFCRTTGDATSAVWVSVA